MKPLLLAFCLASLLFSTVRAGETKPAAIELKKKSTFDASDDRDTFWPIGWKKPGPKTSSNNAAGPGLTANSFSLTSITMGHLQRFVILNGKTMQEGQEFGLQYGNQVYQVTLRSIQDGQVILVYQDNEIVVPLRRH